METILPNDMIGEVMKYLSNSDLANYGQTSKMGLESSEVEWKTRYNHLEGEKTEDTEANPLVYWMKNYSVNIIHQFRSKMKVKFQLIDMAHNKKDKASIISGMFDLILENRLLFFQNSKFKNFRDAVEEKLKQFFNGTVLEQEIAEKYYPLLFLESYMILCKERNDMLTKSEEYSSDNEISDDYE